MFIKCFLFVILYLIVSSIVTFPYSIMSGWDVDFAFFLLKISPIFLVIWLFLTLFAGIIYASHDGKIRLSLRALFRFKKEGISKDFLLLFWIYTIWILLPIILRLISIVLDHMGLDSLADIIYSQRYLSMMYVLFIFCVLFALWQPVEDLCNKFMKKVSEVIDRRGF